MLSSGEWRNAETDWHTPGIGGIVHNPPGILHAMRANNDAPIVRHLVPCGHPSGGKPSSSTILALDESFTSDYERRAFGAQLASLHYIQDDP